MNSTLETIVQTIAEIDAKALTATPSTVVQLQQDKSITCDSLQSAFRKTPAAAVCLAPLTAAVIADLVNQDNLPEGTVRQFKGFTLHGTHIHTFVTYNPKNSKAGPYVIDATNPERTIFDLSNPADRNALEQSYENRGLPGALDVCFGAYGIQSSKAYKIADALIGKIKDEEAFTQQGYVCPITQQVPQDPVHIHGEKEAVYERVAIEQWLARHGTSPLTRKPIEEKDLHTAFEARQAIIGLTMQQNRDDVPDLRAAPSRKSLQQIQAIVIAGRIKQDLPKIKVDQPIEELKDVKTTTDEPLMPFWKKVLIGVCVGLLVGVGISLALALTFVTGGVAAEIALLLLIPVAAGLIGGDLGAIIGHNQEAGSSVSTTGELSKRLGVKGGYYQLPAEDDDRLKVASGQESARPSLKEIVLKNEGDDEAELLLTAIKPSSL